MLARALLGVAFARVGRVMGQMSCVLAPMIRITASEAVIVVTVGTADRDAGHEPRFVIERRLSVISITVHLYF